MTDNADAPKRPFLLLHDYGMGGSWWWVRARSKREVLETFAWVEVVTDPDAVARSRDEGLEEVDIDGPRMPPGLDGLRAQRDAQRECEGFGALAERDVAFLRRRWDEEGDEPVVYLMEVGSDGRRIRQVELAEDGTAVRSGPDDWPFNPPIVDLFDPVLSREEISRSEFEEHWTTARQADAES
ncbi:hypothetical protein SJX93_00515 [Streptomyces cyaneofuscatus]|uniref:hypothetical protein n=1 Tax=Streptomyces cyaneofuscatus TaxID=66883 RepID=UPI002D79364A|nr:hypothetical protein [Streptomyces cyaneofuscatus]WRO08184.1 hypothetical protein SJX93_00515 [Streptomyces cyaneofuscatus]